MRHYRMLIVDFVTILLFDYLYLYYMCHWNFCGINFTKADAFILVTYVWFLIPIIVPISIISVCYLSLHYYELNIVIRYASKRKLWLYEVRQMLHMSAELSLLITIATFVNGQLLLKEKINFEDKHSLFAYFNNGYTMDSPKIQLLIVAFMVYYFLILSIVNLLFILLKLIICNNLLGFILTFIIVYLSSIKGILNFIFGCISINYQRWFTHKHFGFVYGVTLILIFVLIGIKISERKEFLGEK